MYIQYIYIHIIINIILYAHYICFYAGRTILLRHIYQPHREGQSVKILSYMKLVHGIKKLT